jgi:uncharacterized protein (TIGR02268 family)
MPLLPPALLLALALLAAPAASAQPLPECPATLRVEAHAAAPAPPPVVCLSPGQDTVWRVDAALLPGEQGLEVTGDGPPLPMARRADSFAVPLPDDFPTGARYRLTLRFAGGEAPAALTLEVVVHPALATRQVRVYRHARPAEDLAREALEARAEARQCVEERARLEATCSVEAGLRGLLLRRERPEASEFAARDLRKVTTKRKGNALALWKIVAYRAGDYRALVVELTDPGPTPWSAAGARLVGPQGEVLSLLPLGQVAPLLPGKALSLVVVELAKVEKLPPGPFTLTLWNEEGKRTVTLGNLSFP